MTRKLAKVCVAIGTAATVANAVPPTINVTWNESPPPVEDVNYTIDDTDPDFPDHRTDYWKFDMADLVGGRR